MTIPGVGKLVGTYCFCLCGGEQCTYRQCQCSYCITSACCTCYRIGDCIRCIKYMSIPYIRKLVGTYCFCLCGCEQCTYRQCQCSYCITPASSARYRIDNCTRCIKYMSIPGVRKLVGTYSFCLC